MPSVHRVSRSFLSQLGVSDPPREPHEIGLRRLHRDANYFRFRPTVVATTTTTDDDDDDARVVSGSSASASAKKNPSSVTLLENNSKRSGGAVVEEEEANGGGTARKRICNNSGALQHAHAHAHHATSPNSNSTPGVNRTPGGKWMVTMRYHNKPCYMGVFDTRDEAIAANDVARRTFESTRDRELSKGEIEGNVGSAKEAAREAARGVVTARRTRDATSVEEVRQPETTTTTTTTKKERGGDHHLVRRRTMEEEGYRSGNRKSPPEWNATTSTEEEDGRVVADDGRTRTEPPTPTRDSADDGAASETAKKSPSEDVVVGSAADGRKGRNRSATALAEEDGTTPPTAPESSAAPASRRKSPPEWNALPKSPGTTTTTTTTTATSTTTTATAGADGTAIESKSATVGVFRKSSGKWMLSISYRGKKRYMGTFPTRGDAVAANVAARRTLESTRRSKGLSNGEIRRRVTLAKEAALRVVADGRPAMPRDDWNASIDQPFEDGEKTSPPPPPPGDRTRVRLERTTTKGSVDGREPCESTMVATCGGGAVRINEIAKESNAPTTTEDLEALGKTTTTTENDNRSFNTAKATMGVFKTSSGKWMVQIGYQGRSRYIGIFDAKDDAVAANVVARRTLESTLKSKDLTKDEIERNIQMARDVARDCSTIGVYYYKRDDVWMVSFRYHGQSRFIGCFASKDEAVLANTLARRKLGSTWKSDLTEEEIKWNVTLAQEAAQEASAGGEPVPPAEELENNPHQNSKTPKEEEDMEEKAPRGPVVGPHRRSRVLRAHRSVPHRFVACPSQRGLGADDGDAVFLALKEEQQQTSDDDADLDDVLRLCETKKSRIRKRAPPEESTVTSRRKKKSCGGKAVVLEENNATMSQPRITKSLDGGGGGGGCTMPKTMDWMTTAGVSQTPYGKWNVLAVGLGSCVYLWSAATSRVTQLCVLSPTEDAVTSVAWSEGGRHLAIGSTRGDVQLWDASAQRLLRTMTGHSARVGALSWKLAGGGGTCGSAPPGHSSLLASGSRDRLIHLRDPRSDSAYEMRLCGHKQEVCGLRWSFDERSMLASGGNDNKLLVWDVKKHARPFHTFADHTAAVKAIAWSPHQHGLLASGGGTADRCIRFWNCLTGHGINCIDTGSQVCNLAFSKNCNELVSTHGYSLNQIVVWKYPSMQKIATLTGHTYRVLYLALSPDGSTIVTGAGDETLRFWQVFPGPQKENKAGGLLFPAGMPGSVIR